MLSRTFQSNIIWKTQKEKRPRSGPHSNSCWLSLHLKLLRFHFSSWLWGAAGTSTQSPLKLPYIDKHSAFLRFSIQLKPVCFHTMALPCLDLAPMVYNCRELATFTFLGVWSQPAHPLLLGTLSLLQHQDQSLSCANLGNNSTCTASPSDSLKWVTDEKHTQTAQ